MAYSGSGMRSVDAKLKRSSLAIDLDITYNGNSHATCVVTMLNEVVHRSEMVPIECESDRRMKAMARAEQKARTRATLPRKGKKA